MDNFSKRYNSISLLKIDNVRFRMQHKMTKLFVPSLRELYQLDMRHTHLLCLIQYSNCIFLYRTQCIVPLLLPLLLLLHLARVALVLFNPRVTDHPHIIMHVKVE